MKEGHAQKRKTCFLPILEAESMYRSKCMWKKRRIKDRERKNKREAQGTLANIKLYPMYIIASNPRKTIDNIDRERRGTVKLLNILLYE